MEAARADAEECQKTIADLEAQQNAREEAQQRVSDLLQKGKDLRAELDALGAKIEEDSVALAEEESLREHAAQVETLRAALEKEFERQSALAALQSKEAALRAEASRAAAAYKAAKESAKRDLLDRQREVDDAIMDMQRVIDQSRANYETECARLQDMLEDAAKKNALLETAGCKSRFLPCPFIDDARAAQERLGNADATLAEFTEALQKEDFSHEERAAITRLLQEKEGLIERPVSETEVKQATDALNAFLQEPAIGVVNVPEAKRKLAGAEDAAKLLGELGAIRARMEANSEKYALKRKEREEVGQQYKDALAAVPGDDVEEAIRSARSSLAESLNHADVNQTTIECLLIDKGGFESQLRALTAAEAELATLKESVEAIRVEAAETKALADFFGPTGAPQLLISLALPEVNSILADITREVDDRYTISFDTQREFKSKEGAEEGLFINVTDSHGTRDITEYSGGQQRLFSKIVREALGFHEASRAGMHHGVYCVDEPTIGLDDVLVPNLLSTISKLATKFRQVIVVDHNPTLLAGIPFRLIVEEKDGASTVRVQQ